MTFCPVSHIPLDELKMAVVFKNDARVVYDAKQLVHWLKNYKRINPMTNAVVPCGKISSVLVPFRLPHMSPEDLEKTSQFLDQEATYYGDHLSPVVGRNVYVCASVLRPSRVLCTGCSRCSSARWIQ